MNSYTPNGEINLLEVENQNMNISLELFEIIKQNAEEYCNYIRKYKECTSAYFEKLSKISYNIKKDNNILNKNLNISSIFSILNKIPDLVRLQIDGIKKFVDSLDLTITPLENVLKNEMNSLEEPKRLFEDNKKKYQKNMAKHKKLMETFSITERKIVKYYLSKKKQKDYTEEKNNMIVNLMDNKMLEKEFIEGTNGENFHYMFQEDSLKNIDMVKSHIKTILENLNSCILFFLMVFNNCYSPCVNFVQKETNNINSQQMNTANLINENMYIKTYNLDELPSDKYIVKIFNKKGIEKLSYSIDFSAQNIQKESNFSNIINFFIKTNDEIDEDEILTTLNKIDLLGIAKKFFHNFKMISKTNYNIKSEEEKITSKNLSDKLLLMKKYKKSKKIDKIITKEEKNQLYELVKKKENADIFLTRLNKIRTFGNFEYPKKVIEDIQKIFLIILDTLDDSDSFLFQFCLILSQTFYYVEKGAKIYLYKNIKHHKAFHSEDMWRNMIDSIIIEKKEKFNEIEYKIENNDEQKKKEKIIEIVFAQLIAIVHNMVDFEFDLNITEKIMEEYIDKYNLTETHKLIIMEMVENKKKENETKK